MLTSAANHASACRRETSLGQHHDLCVSLTSISCQPHSCATLLGSLEVTCEARWRWSLSEPWHPGDLSRLLLFVWGTGPHLQCQVHRISFQGKEKRLKTQPQSYSFLLQKRKPILMIILVFYTAFHCLVLCAVSCAASLGYIFVNSHSSPYVTLPALLYFQTV